MESGVSSATPHRIRRLGRTPNRLTLFFHPPPLAFLPDLEQLSLLKLPGVVIEPIGGHWHPIRCIGKQGRKLASVLAIFLCLLALKFLSLIL
jgi:hypothetical protein